MHTYELLTDQSDLEKRLQPFLEANKIEVPAPGCYIAAVEFDENGEVYAYQMAQNALFLEGMYAKGAEAHLLRLYHMVVNHLVRNLGAKHIMTMTRDDDTGQRIGRIAQALKFVKQNWNVYRRKF